MNDTQKRIVLSQPLVERGGALVQVETKPLAVASQGVVEGAALDMSQKERELVAIKLAALCRVPMKRVAIRERFQRVYLVEFEPHASYDPVMPLATIDLGADHNEAYRLLARSLAAWRPDDWYQVGWYDEAMKYARRCITGAVRFLNRQEAEYYAHEMTYSIANPDRRSLV